MKKDMDRVHILGGPQDEPRFVCTACGKRGRLLL